MRRFASLFLSLAVLVPAFAQKGVVEFSVNYMREAPDYAAELGNQALMGTEVEILDSTGYWLKIRTSEPYTAWVNEMGIIRMSAEEIEEYRNAPKYICIADYSNVYSEPDYRARRVSDLVLGDVLRARFSVYYRSHYYKLIRIKGFSAVLLPSGKTGFVPSADLELLDKRAGRLRGSGADIVSTARRFLGVPYLWGGTSIKGFDCSGLTSMVFRLNGINLPRNASEQALCGEAVGKDSLSPGDLLFFGNKETGSVTHVGIYSGGGRMIHSSQVVRENSLDPREPDFYEGAGRFLHARRICPF